MRGLAPFLRDAWRLAVPYYNSEEKWRARFLLLVIIALNLSLVGMSVVLSYWHREFYNALQNKDWTSFIELLFTWRSGGGSAGGGSSGTSGFMPGFSGIAVVYILIAIHRTYLNQLLQIRWRTWFTGRFLDEWLADRAYYRISLMTAHTGEHGATGTDNPDQRISDDLQEFVQSTLSLGLGLLSNVVSLFSFVGILWGLSGAMTVFGVNIPGYMVWVALAYAILGTWLTHLVGRPLVGLNFRQQRVEADFRYALVRLRENMEGIALHGGEGQEKGNLLHRFGAVIGNFRAIMIRTKYLNSLIAGYGQVASVFPIVVAAPRYFAGQMQLGELMQTAGAFSRVQDAMSWFVEAYSSLASWRATTERLATFHRAIVAARAQSGQGIQMAPAADGNIALQDLTLALPDGTDLLTHTDLNLRAGNSVVISGRSGSGKSTLFRALAGIWPFGQGRVLRPEGKCLFLPQRPYIPLGNLRHAVSYPAPVEAYSHEQVVAALQAVGLPKLVAQMDVDQPWAQRLSGGEQQRLALARALLARPDWLFLDEATASLDPEGEAEVYRMLKDRLPNTTIVSIAHRTGVAKFHDERLVFERGEGAGSGRLLEAGAVDVAD